ncbi:MAG: restriction endonuclease subunit S [Fenollaria massiliensis]
MSKIDEMLKNEKVEWKKLGDVCEFKRGKSITKKNVKEGNIPVIAGGQKPAYYHSEFNRSGQTITVAGSGAYAGFLGFWEEPIFLSDAFSIETCDLLNKKYLYYYLLNMQDKIYDLKKGSGIPHVYGEDMARLMIAIPSLEIQEKIAKTLDKFTNYLTELQAELQAELQSRNKQYEYYRDKLLSEEHLNKLINKYDLYKYELKETTLGEVIKLKNGRDWKNLNEGDIPVYGSGGSMNIGVNKFSYDKETVLIPRKGSIDNIFYLNEPFWNVDTIYYTEVNTKLLNVKYFYYFMKNIDLISLSINPTRPSLTQEIINNINITLPPIEIQEKIVEILDKFQALTQDVSGLLPDEIEKREKQYEYYREKLLTFDTKCTSGGGYHLLSKDYISLLTQAGALVGVKVFELEERSLGEIAKVTKLAGYEFTKYVNYKEDGNIIALRGLNVKKGKIVLNDVKYIDGSDLSKLTRSKLMKDDILFTYVGTIGEVGLVNLNDKYYLAPNVAMIRITENDIISKYLIYLFQTNSFKHKQINKWLEASSMKNLTMENIRKFKILIPPKPIQEYIVSILDKFEALSQSTTEGLRREIELREKQYEYYREKLLTFEK